MFYFYLFWFGSFFMACLDTVFFLSGWVPVDARSVALSWLPAHWYLGLFFVAKRNPFAASICGLVVFSLLSILYHVMSDLTPQWLLALELGVTGLNICLFLYILHASLVYRRLKNKKPE
jgi:hypothetical protein